jgi:hypothetical protein
MIRRVAFGKAILAGATGALAWEVVVRVLILLGLPLFELQKVIWLKGTPTIMIGEIDDPNFENT